MRVLTFTSLYPNKTEPRLGHFVKNRMDHFDQIAGTCRKVIAPVQYFPLLGLAHGSRFHDYNRVPKYELHGSIPVYHPRYITVPGTNLIDVAGAMMKAADRILPDVYPGAETFDLVDGHYLYPDGVAAFKLAKKYARPLILTARGSDVNFWMEQEKPEKSILQAIDYASKVICVSHALKERLIRHGVDKNKLIVIMNGVDRGIFNFQDNEAGEYLLTVGNLVPLKGHDYILQALATMPDEKLIIIGKGNLDGKLKERADRLNISHRVSFLSDITHHKLPAYYSKAKCTILMSSMEGMPNVVLESLACGTPVIATTVGGIPEVITKDNGILLAERSGEALTDALDTTLTRKWDRKQIAKDMNYLDWQETARELHRCFSKTIIAS